ncbi:CxxH/CxxC protein (TIGR04129 family) [Clostridium algifaecis]|uniref:CxxH/CxxC protein (TIGR04129 family) n=2 Tax=Clostridium algifaecis TaxID=1472040 RepID=A0ABS4KUX7_9CLOT|nr:CxxH/CxxC protein (TIGR04129 family) [Clostridium algifaecis]
MAIDDFLVENETFPYLVYVNNLDVGEDLNQNCNFKCSYCDKIARYALKIKS